MPSKLMYFDPGFVSSFFESFSYSDVRPTVGGGERSVKTVYPLRLGCAESSFRLLVRGIFWQEDAAGR